MVLARVEIDIVMERTMIKKARILNLVFLFRYSIYNVLFLINRYKLRFRGTGFTFCMALNAGRQKKSVSHFK